MCVLLGLIDVGLGLRQIAGGLGLVGGCVVLDRVIRRLGLLLRFGELVAGVAQRLVVVGRLLEFIGLLLHRIGGLRQRLACGCLVRLRLLHLVGGLGDFIGRLGRRGQRILLQLLQIGRCRGGILLRLLDVLLQLLQLRELVGRVHVLLLLGIGDLLVQHRCRFFQAIHHGLLLRCRIRRVLCLVCGVLRLICGGLVGRSGFIFVLLRLTVRLRLGWIGRSLGLVQSGGALFHLLLRLGHLGGRCLIERLELGLGHRGPVVDLGLTFRQSRTIQFRLLRDGGKILLIGDELVELGFCFLQLRHRINLGLRDAEQVGQILADGSLFDDGVRERPFRRKLDRGIGSHFQGAAVHRLQHELGGIRRGGSVGRRRFLRRSGQDLEEKIDFPTDGSLLRAYDIMR